MSTALAILPKVWACQSLHEVVKPASPQPEPEQQQPEPEQTVAPSLAFYRKYTEAMLRRYMRLSMEFGRAPSLLGREMFRGKVTSCRVTGFDDVVIFVHDVERCIAKLNGIQQRFVIRIAVQEYTQDITLHQASAYIAMGIGLPVLFALLSQASRFRWAATTGAAVYTIFLIGEILILPLFPAQPKLGPVFFPVTHLIPAKFPILILVPALALDLFWQRARNWKPWQIALVSGVLFVAVLTAVEWPFANFLMSHASQNRFFGTMYFGYNTKPTSDSFLRLFADSDGGATLYLGLLRTSIYASISTWIGLAFGRWMRGVQR